MKTLADHLNEDVIRRLKRKIAAGDFPGVTFVVAMKFLLTNGLLPKSGLPARSFLSLENWVRAAATNDAQSNLVYTTTQLKNQTGEILEHVLRGKTVTLVRHGRSIAAIGPCAGFIRS